MTKIPLFLQFSQKSEEVCGKHFFTATKKNNSLACLTRITIYFLFFVLELFR